MYIYNSLSENLDKIIPLNPKKVTIYVCGITPYDTTHLGHAFTYIAFDALIKYLKYKGYEIEYTQNVTDVNDRDNDILKRAKEQNIAWQQLADYWTTRFLSDMNALNWTKPTHFLKASENIPAILDLIKTLIQNNLAYEVKGSVYLETAKDRDFGKLSRFFTNRMLKIAGNFEEDTQNPDKKNPLDITLWKASSINQAEHIPSFDSPFGKGRPGWHIECSAMAISSLGEQLDFHGGGIDLIYPHHEAEIAQSEGATNKIPFVKYWLHTGAVYYQKEKMSKSLGNLVMVSKLLEKYSANAIRWVLLSHHWQKDWEFKESELDEATKNLADISKILGNRLNVLGKNNTPNTNILINEFTQAMEDNLNTPKALDIILSFVRKSNPETKTAQPEQVQILPLMMKILGFQHQQYRF